MRRASGPSSGPRLGSGSAVSVLIRVAGMRVAPLCKPRANSPREPDSPGTGHISFLNEGCFPWVDLEPLERLDHLLRRAFTRGWREVESDPRVSTTSDDDPDVVEWRSSFASRIDPSVSGSFPF